MVKARVEKIGNEVMIDIKGFLSADNEDLYAKMM